MSHYVVPESTNEVYYPVSKKKMKVDRTKKIICDSAKENKCMLDLTLLHILFLACISIALILIISLPGLELAIYAQEQEQFLMHQDTKGKFAIQYPRDWKREIQGDGVSFSVPNTTVIFSIQVQSLGKFDSLEQFADSQVQDIQRLGSNRQIPEGLSFATIDGQRVIRAESESSFGENFGYPSEKTLHLWTVAGDDTFTFDFTTREDLYREYLPTVEKMIDSFRFV